MAKRHKGPVSMSKSLDWAWWLGFAGWLRDDALGRLGSESNKNLQNVSFTAWPLVTLALSPSIKPLAFYPVESRRYHPLVLGASKSGGRTMSLSSDTILVDKLVTKEQWSQDISRYTVSETASNTAWIQRESANEQHRWIYHEQLAHGMASYKASRSTAMLRHVGLFEAINTQMCSPKPKPQLYYILFDFRLL